MKTSFLILGIVTLLSFSPIVLGALPSPLYSNLRGMIAQTGRNPILIEVIESTPWGDDILKAVLKDKYIPVESRRLGDSSQLLVSELERTKNSSLAQELSIRLEQIDKEWTLKLENNHRLDDIALAHEMAGKYLKVKLISSISNGQKVKIQFEFPLKTITAEQKLLTANSALLDQQGKVKQLLNSLTPSSPLFPAKKLLDDYEQVINTLEQRMIFPSSLIETQILDQEMSLYTLRFKQLLDLLRDAGSGETFTTKLQAAAKKLLAGKVPQESIQQRIEDYIKSPGDMRKFRRLMGDMELDEVNYLLYGNDPKNPSPESLLGQYLEKTGAVMEERFMPDPAAGNELVGKTRLLVPVTNETAELWMSLFMRHEFFSIFGHTKVLHMGKLSSYSDLGTTFDLKTMLSPYPLPIIALKTTEGQRLAQFRQLQDSRMVGYWNSPELIPWMLKGPEGNYCIAGIWRDCTHWIGNIPIGDARTMTYKLPGDDKGQTPRIRKLKPWSNAPEIPINNIDLAKRVWKTPGNLQLAEVLGDLDRQLRSEYANSGWINRTLLGATSSERISIVFVKTENLKGPLPAYNELALERPR